MLPPVRLARAMLLLLSVVTLMLPPVRPIRAMLLLPVALVMLPLVRLPHAGGSRGNSSMRSGG